MHLDIRFLQPRANGTAVALDLSNPPADGQLLVAICRPESVSTVPSGVIGKEEMGDILWDIMQADQYAANYIVKDSGKVNVKMETLKLYEEVFRMHKVSRDEFRKSFQFYQDHPDITRTMFDSLVAKGNRMRAESYTPSQTAAPSAPAIRPAVTGPMGKPPILTPGKPAGTLPNRPVGTPPNQPGGIHPPNKFILGKDSTKFRRKGVQFLPGRNSPTPGGTQPFQVKDTTKH